MASVRAMASSFRARMRGGQALAPEASPEIPPPSPGATCPTLEISCQVHRVPVTVSVELDTFPDVQRTTRFPGDHTSQQVSHPRKCRVPREEPGTSGQDRVLATVPHQVERGQTGFPVGSQALAVPRLLGDLLSWKCPHPALMQQMFTEYLELP